MSNPPPCTCLPSCTRAEHALTCECDYHVTALNGRRIAEQAATIARQAAEINELRRTVRNLAQRAVWGPNGDDPEGRQ